jgi:hypothetical protein
MSISFGRGARLGRELIRAQRTALIDFPLSAAEDHPPEAPLGDGEIDHVDDDHRHHRPQTRVMSAPRNSTACARLKEGSLFRENLGSRFDDH